MMVALFQLNSKIITQVVLMYHLLRILNSAVKDFLFIFLAHN